MWEQHRRDARVVVDHLSLGEPDLWIQNLVEIRELEPPALYFHLYAALGGHRPCGSRWAPRSAQAFVLALGLRFAVEPAEPARVPAAAGFFAAASFFAAPSLFA